MQELMTLLLPVIVAALTTVVLQALKKSATFVDGLPTLVKQLAAIVIAFLLTKLSALMAVALPGSLTELSTSVEAVQALLSGLAAMGIHAIFKPKPEGTAAK